MPPTHPPPLSHQGSPSGSQHWPHPIAPLWEESQVWLRSPLSHSPPQSCKGAGLKVGGCAQSLPASSGLCNSIPSTLVQRLETWTCEPKPGDSCHCLWARAHDHICFSLLALLRRVETEEIGGEGRLTRSKAGGNLGRDV